jgi:hypothetical protein
MRITLFCTLLGAAVLTPAAWAQSVEARRYVGAGGVEIIQSRDAGTVVKAAAPAVSAPVAAVREMQISPATQQARDKDRLAILEHELLSEAAAFTKKSQMLQSPSARAKLSSEEVAQLKDSLHGTEENIRALNAEIGRAKRQH